MASMRLAGVEMCDGTTIRRAGRVLSACRRAEVREVLRFRPLSITATQVLGNSSGRLCMQECLKGGVINSENHTESHSRIAIVIGRWTS